MLCDKTIMNNKTKYIQKKRRMFMWLWLMHNVTI